MLLDLVVASPEVMNSDLIFSAIVPMKGIWRAKGVKRKPTEHKRVIMQIKAATKVLLFFFLIRISHATRKKSEEIQIDMNEVLHKESPETTNSKIDEIRKAFFLR